MKYLNIILSISKVIGKMMKNKRDLHGRLCIHLIWKWKRAV